VMQPTTVEKKGTVKRLVCDTVTEKVPVTESYCEMEPYTYTVQVPVGGYGAGYGFGGDCGGYGHGHRGLFGRGK
jgi:hypothetical protein